MKLKIGSYNIANGSWVGHDFSRLAEDIVSAGLDIVGLQEVDRGCNRSKLTDGAAELSRLTGLKYYRHTRCIGLPGGGGEGDYGTAIISRYPIIDSGSFVLDSGIHEQRMLGYCAIDCGDDTVHFFNTHLSWEEEPVRRGQFDFIANVTRDMAHAVVTGDFNVQSVDEFDRLPMEKVCSREYAPLTCGDDGTIDNIFYTADFKLISRDVTETKKSDHCLLAAEFEL